MSPKVAQSAQEAQELDFTYRQLCARIKLAGLGAGVVLIAMSVWGFSIPVAVLLGVVCAGVGRLALRRLESVRLRCIAEFADESGDVENPRELLLTDVVPPLGRRQRLWLGATTALLVVTVARGL